MNKLKILVVDDESRMRKLVRDFLEKQNFAVLEAGDGSEALDIFFDNQDIALIILDVMMPKMDGWQVCREVRGYSEVPIIMLTARSDERDELQGFELGVDEYISKPFSPKILVARVEAILRRTNQVIDDKIAEDLYISFDREKIQKVLNNLLSNAFKFTPAGGMVTITLDTCKEPDGVQYFRLCVKDTGAGIPRKNLSHIFERFYQVKEEEDKIGSGIGLHLVKEYVELHSGKIEVESEVNKGSLFTVYLPVRTDVEVDAELLEEEDTFIGDELNPDAESNQDLQMDKEYTILLVEDNKEFRHYMFELLSKKYNVLEAGDGEEGERIATTKFPDLIISDIMMPKVDGLELCKRIKSNIQVSHIPVILLTARSTDESKLFGYESGADEYISKPFNLDILLLRIQKLINEEKARQKSFSQGININPGEVTITSIDEQFIEKVCALIQKNIDNPEYSVEKLSADVGMERTVLYRKLNAIAGQTPSDFIRSIRLKHAAQLLNKGYQVGEVADMVGFNTPKYFTKYFKQAFGVTPSQYKTNMTGES